MNEGRAISTAELLPRVGRWRAGEPGLGGTVDEDASALARYAAAGEELAAQLPAKPDRGEPEQRLGDLVFESCRRVRNRFIRRHADEVYDALTDVRSTHLRLSELVFCAAERYPGLVPTRAQIEAEREHIQAHKDGREIDQGIFFRGVLRSPVAGAHLVDGMLLPSPRAVASLAEFRRTARLDLDTVLVERRGHAAHLTVHNEHCLNAEDNQLVSDMETAIDLALLDEQVRVGVLRGGVMTHPSYLGRRVFNAGINLTDLHDGAISFVDFFLGRELGCIGKLVHGLLIDPADDAWPDRMIQKPWVAAVDSFAIGGGMQLLLAFDHVVAAEDAYFSLPAAQEGIVPGLSNLRLGRFTGSRLGRRIILSGRKIRATDPEAPLLCDEVVPPADVDAAVDRAVRNMDKPAVVANRRMLNLAEEPFDLLRAYLAEFAVNQARRMYSRDVLDKVERQWSLPRART